MTQISFQKKSPAAGSAAKFNITVISIVVFLVYHSSYMFAGDKQTFITISCLHIDGFVALI